MPNQSLVLNVFPFLIYKAGLPVHYLDSQEASPLPINISVVVTFPGFAGVSNSVIHHAGEVTVAVG